MTVELEPWQVKYQCKNCKDVIFSSYDGEFKSCKCRSIAVDQTPYYERRIGNMDNFERLDNSETLSNS